MTIRQTANQAVLWLFIFLFDFCGALAAPPPADETLPHSRLENSRLDSINNKLFDEHVKQADQYRKRHKYKEALKIYSKCLNVLHNSPANEDTNRKTIAVLKSQLDCEWNLKNYRSAKQYSEQLHKLEPENTELLYTLYSCENKLENCKSALRYAEELVARNRNKYINLRAQAYEQLKMYAQAAQDYQEVIKLKPADFQVRYNFAQATLHTGNWEEPSKILVRGLKECKPDYQSLEKTANFLHFLGKKQECLDTVQKLIRMYPNRFQSWQFAGNSYASLKLPEEARKYFAKAKQLAPNDAGLKVYMTMFESDSGQTISRNKLLALSKEKITDPEILFYRGHFFQSMSMYDEAIRDYDAAFAKGWLMAQTSKAWLLKDLHRKEEAAAAAQLAVQRFPNESSAQETAGIMLCAISQTEKALPYFTKALTIEPDNVVSLYARAAAYQSMEDGNKALADINKLLKLKPDDAKAYKLRAEVYKYLLNNQELAAKDFTTYSRLKAIQPH